CLLICLFFPIPLVGAQEPATAPATPSGPVDPVGDAALAENFAQLSQLLLSRQVINDTIWHEVIALLKAATRLNPGEERYPRLLVEACLVVHDTDGAINALRDYRRLSPDDR